MSDTPQGPDWWQASDDKWYPPPRPEMPGQPEPAVAPAAAPGMPPPGAPGVPTGPPTGPPPGGYGAPGPFAPPGGPSGGFPPGPSGPYPPGGAPRPGSSNRTALFIAIGVVVAAALVGLVVVLTSGGDDDPPTTGGPGTTLAPAPNGGDGGGTGGDPGTTEPAPSGDASVAVVDSGFQNFMGGFDGDERSVTYGFIVENSGEELATDISVSVSAYDAEGNAVATASHTIYVLRPGEKMGLGDEFFGDTFAADVDRVDFQVSEPGQGFGAENVPAEGGLTAEGITTNADDYSITTTFTAKSTYAEQIDSPSVYAIYRNADGAIIGGSSGYLDFIPPNGSTAGEVRSWELIPNVDTTEVYMDPGYFS
jgi:hypothetical protein